MAKKRKERTSASTLQHPKPGRVHKADADIIKIWQEGNKKIARLTKGLKSPEKEELTKEIHGQCRDLAARVANRCGVAIGPVGLFPLSL